MIKIAPAAVITKSPRKTWWYYFSDIFIHFKLIENLVGTNDRTLNYSTHKLCVEIPTKANDKVFRHVLMYCTFSKSKWIFSLILRRIVDLRYYFMYETSFFQKIHISDFFTLSYCNNRNHAVSLRKLLNIYFSGFSALYREVLNFRCKRLA